jgi:hypothetical protein
MSDDPPYDAGMRELVQLEQSALARAHHPKPNRPYRAAA